jgi:hypothetical protein
MTFSISARCPQSGMFGIAISSSSPAVAARCAHAKAGVGVVASQNITDPALGQRGLALMAGGFSAEQALRELLNDYSFSAWRQMETVLQPGFPETRRWAFMRSHRAITPLLRAIFLRTMQFRPACWRHSKLLAGRLGIGSLAR